MEGGSKSKAVNKVKIVVEEWKVKIVKRREIGVDEGGKEGL